MKKTYFSESLAMSIETRADYKKIAPLRLCQVATLIATDCINKEIGVILGISRKTVEKHRQKLMRQFDLRGTAAITRWALANNFIDNNFNKNK